MTRVAIAPELQGFTGWKTDISGIKSAKDLPEAAQKYITFIDQYLGVKISWISNGPGRDQLIEII
jgi:adenylosuccinate synthase